jgi:hypothetical protein
MKKISIPSNQELNINESNFQEKFKYMARNVELWKIKKKKFINNFVKNNGKLQAKAFPGRAAILIKLLEIDENSIQAVYEKEGSMKIGNYLPGTRIPIYSDKILFSKENIEKPLLNLAWHISEEIRKYLSENNFNGEIYDLVNKNDFEIE